MSSSGYGRGRGRICAFFNTPRGCNRGSACGFIHDASLPPGERPSAVPSGRPLGVATAPGSSPAIDQGPQQQFRRLARARVLSIDDYRALCTSALRCLDSEHGDMVCNALGGAPDDGTESTRDHMKAICSTWTKYADDSGNAAMEQKVRAHASITALITQTLLCTTEHMCCSVALRKHADSSRVEQ